ncbi:prepilin peptidase [Roseitranquillus sediminis]|uniref:prepilin peptidase n=1 Tax=Roseitranquillus sediminis TaxID=2809051 RepID=UPI001D0CA58B|nr:prepilin peptidase [Roseitranquillus sediminis]MBM9594753.1 prepilin peptidase [Roseitranquillus sediminis]
MIESWIFSVVFLGFLGWAAYCDAADLRIPNRLTLAMAGMGPFAVWLLGPGVGALPAAFLAGATTLIVTWTMFELGLLGGGDAKLAAAAALWLGLEATLVFVLATAVFGAVLAASLVILSRSAAAQALVGLRWQERLNADAISVPYAVAMAPAGVVATLTMLSQA